jgi:uncharacterized Zn finger protein (UPF0148 family)
MANDNGGRVCSKCGMNLGQKHLCPICDRPEPEEETGSFNASSAQTRNEAVGAGRTCPKCGMNLGQKHLCPVCDAPEPESRTDVGNASAPDLTSEPGASAPEQSAQPERPRNEPETERSETEHPRMGNAGFARLTNRISLLMSQHDWQGAGGLCREALALEPDNAELHFRLAMAELEAPSESELWKANRRLSGNQSFQTAMRLADPEFKKRLHQMLHAATVEVVIPDGETRIGNEAFKDCADMASIAIPDSVTEIGESAFDGCVSLASVVLPRELTEIAAGVFRNCISLTSVTIPNNVTRIGSNAFDGCSALTSVAFPRGLTEIGESAFEGCSGLTSVTFPNGARRIDARSFADCRALNAVELPDSLSKVGKDAFLNVPQVTIRGGLLNRVQTVFGKANAISFAIAPGVTTIPEKAFDACRGLVSVTIPDTVTSIGAYAFSGCSGLTSVAIPDSVTAIGEHAFGWCTGLTSVTIPNSVTSIGVSAFYGCSGLTSAAIPDSVTAIGEHAFYGCSGLTSVTIPDSVTTIGREAFVLCTGLTSVTIPRRLKKRWRDIFVSCPNLPRPMDRSVVLRILISALICVVSCLAVKPVFGITWRNALIIDGIVLPIILVSSLLWTLADDDLSFLQAFFAHLLLLPLPLLVICGLVNWCFSIPWWGIAIVGLVVFLIAELLINAAEN